MWRNMGHMLRGHVWVPELNESWSDLGIWGYFIDSGFSNSDVLTLVRKEVGITMAITMLQNKALPRMLQLTLAISIRSGPEDIC